MEKGGTAIVSILTAIIGVSILAVLLSSKSNTTNVLTAAAQGFSGILSVAMSPITGATGGGFGTFSGGGGSSGPLSMLSGSGSPLAMLSGGSNPLSMLLGGGGTGGMFG